MLRAGDLSRESAFLQVLISQRICSSDTLELPEHLSRHSAIRGIAAARLALSYLQLSQTYDSLTESDVSPDESCLKRQWVALHIKDTRTARLSSLDLLTLQAVFCDFQGQSAPALCVSPSASPRSLIYRGWPCGSKLSSSLITAECLHSPFITFLRAFISAVPQHNNSEKRSGKGRRLICFFIILLSDGLLLGFVW